MSQIPPPLTNRSGPIDVLIDTVLEKERKKESTIRRLCNAMMTFLWDDAGSSFALHFSICDV